jgi:hypothetical protein
MIIKCAISRNVPYKDKNGKTKLCTLRPGKHNYPALKPKNDPLLAAELFTLRKHKVVAFDDMLPQDSVPELAAKAELKPSPVGRKVNGKKEADSDRGRRKKNHATQKAPKKEPDCGKPGEVSDKGSNPSS